jgi:2'-5' RNA ligase superfamily
MNEGPAPIIVSALIGEPDFTWLDQLRQQHFPPERNYLRAHLTLFHHLPPSVETELCNLLADLSRTPAPAARVTGLMNMGRGVAFRIESEALADIRDVVASRFSANLTPQDKSPWRSHVTVQNKVAPETARALLKALQEDFIARPFAITGLAAWWYRGGPWEQIAAFKFR